MIKWMEGALSFPGSFLPHSLCRFDRAARNQPHSFEGSRCSAQRWNSEAALKAPAEKHTVKVHS